MRPEFETHAITGVANGGGATDIGADLIALYYIRRRRALVYVHAHLTVSRNNIARTRAWP